MDYIIKIYFFNDELEKAAVLYKEKQNDYKVIIINSKVAKIMLNKYAKDNNYHNLEELKDDGIYEIIGFNDLKKNLKTTLNEIKEKNNKEENEDDNDLEISNKVSNLVNKVKKTKIDKLKIKKFAVRTLFVLGGVVVTSCVYNAIMIRKRQKDLKDTQKITTEASIIEDIGGNEGKYTTVDELLDSAVLNESKKTAISSVWKYINRYNNKIASKNIGSDNTRLAHSWEEVMIDYLVYNSISESDAVQIFDDCTLDASTLKNAYSSSIDQAILGYTVLTESTNKEDLIKSESGKKFYRKYENMLIKFNKSGNNIEEKEKITKEFCTKVYLDFINGNTITESDSYKLSVIPIIKAFNLLSSKIKGSETLTKTNLEYIDNLASVNMVSEYIDKICNAVNSKQNKVTDECAYSEISNQAVEELSDAGLYNLESTARDISNSKEYKSMFKSSKNKSSEAKKDSTKEESTTQTKKSVSNSSKKQKSNHSNSSDNTAAEVPDEKPDKIPKWLLEDNKQKDSTTSNSNSKTNTTTDNTNSTEAPASPSTENDVDNSVLEDVPEVEEDTPDMSFFESSYNGLNNKKDEIKQNYYKKIADNIIEAMASENSSTESVKQNVYTK